jgi:hypothetical protein
MFHSLSHEDTGMWKAGRQFQAEQFAPTLYCRERFIVSLAEAELFPVHPIQPPCP